MIKRNVRSVSNSPTDNAGERSQNKAGSKFSICTVFKRALYNLSKARRIFQVPNLFATHNTEVLTYITFTPYTRQSRCSVRVALGYLEKKLFVVLFCYVPCRLWHIGAASM